MLTAVVRSVVRASADDYAEFARLFPELAVIEPTPSAERFAEVIAPDTFFLREGDKAVGYAWSRARGQQLHVVHVVVDPAHRRRGVGRALMTAIAEQGRAAGFERWMLNVKPENIAARELYEKCGMRALFDGVSMRFRWSDVANLGSESGVSARLLEPHDDARFESALSLGPGDLSNFRAIVGRKIFGVEIAASPIGAGVLDPQFPGVSSLILSAPEHARALFESMRAHAKDEHAPIFVFVEDNAPLEAALTKAGAEPAMRVLRMGGNIPEANADG